MEHCPWGLLMLRVVEEFAMVLRDEGSSGARAAVSHGREPCDMVSRWSPLLGALL